jgi:hypothetical protein
MQKILGKRMKLHEAGNTGVIDGSSPYLIGYQKGTDEASAKLKAVQAQPVAQQNIM